MGKRKYNSDEYRFTGEHLRYFSSSAYKIIERCDVTPYERAASKIIIRLVSELQVHRETEVLNSASESSACKYCGGTGKYRWQRSHDWMPCPCVGCTELAIKQPSSNTENSFTNEELEMMSHGNNPQSNAYRELLARRRNSPANPDGWISISEQLPDPGIFVLVSNGAWVGMGMFNDARHLEDDERWQDEHNEFIDLLHHPVTHWQLPPVIPLEVKHE